MSLEYIQDKAQNDIGYSGSTAGFSPQSADYSSPEVPGAIQSVQK